MFLHPSYNWCVCVSVYNLSTFISFGFYMFETSSYVHCLVYSCCFIPSNVFYPLMQFQSKLILTKMYNHFAVSKFKVKTQIKKMKKNATYVHISYIYKIPWKRTCRELMWKWNIWATITNLPVEIWTFSSLVSAITSLAWSTAFPFWFLVFSPRAHVNVSFGNRAPDLLQLKSVFLVFPTESLLNQQLMVLSVLWK